MGIEQAPLSNPPQAYLDIVLPLVEKAKAILEQGETLQPFAFVGNLTSQQIIAVMLDNNSEEAKDKSASAIKMAAVHNSADFVFTVMEVWSLRPDKMRQHQEIVEKYGSIGASPYAIDVCSLMLETRHGLWVSQPPIKPKGISKKKRTIGGVQFRFFSEVEGRFAHLLPEKDNKSGTLH